MRAVSSVPLTRDLICLLPVGKIREDLDTLSTFGLTLIMVVDATFSGSKESR